VLPYASAMRLIAYFASIFLAGCMISPRPWNQQISAAYDHQEAVAMMRPGTGSISGLVRFGGREASVTCAGAGVTLLAATPYAKQWFAYHFGGWGRVERSTDLNALRPVVKEFLSLARVAECNEEGRFRFEGLREGDYILHASTRGEPSAAHPGLTFYSMVHVNPGASTEVVFSTGPNAPRSTIRYGNAIW
jgi:hypothetical protein